MCRSIKNLFNFDPPATDEEVRSASLQYVRKFSGFNKPSKVNEVMFNQAVDEIALVTRKLIDSLQTTSEFRNREIEAQKAKLRAAKRFGNRE